jgi:hypothetical protein
MQKTKTPESEMTPVAPELLRMTRKKKAYEPCIKRKLAGERPATLDK